MEKIKDKSSYCLNCKIKPCSQKGCPLANNIPGFIEKVKEENYEEAYKILSETTVLQAVCGRICPHKKQCQGSCVRGIKGEPVSIGELEAYIGDIAIKNNYKLFNNNTNTKESEKLLQYKKVAIVGGGPAGITCAAFLAKSGVKVTIFERYDYLGGLLVYGIPEFRLPKNIVKATIDKVLNLGIEVKYNKELGKNINLSDLISQYDAVFLSFGANVSSKMGILGDALEGVFGGNELLEYNLHPEYTNKTVAIIGGGNVAIDCARTVKKMGAKDVKVIYRRSEKEMPAEEKEVEDAKKEEIDFLFQTNIVKVIGSNSVEKLELIKTQLVQKEGETRAVPVNIENSNYLIDCDYVIAAIGSKPNEFVNDLGLELDNHGHILTNENKQTSNPKVFAGGDIAGNKGTVAWAAKSGRDAAEQIIRQFR